MTKTGNEIPDARCEKSKGQVILEYILLALCLCAIALRTTLTEGPTIQSTTLPANLSDSVYSLTVSAGLFVSFVLWFVWSFCSKRFLYRFTTIEIGLCIFCVAAIAAGFAAANKRAAITGFATLVAPLLCAILLVQILDSQSKIKLLLVVIAALGVVSAWQCSEQLFYWNEQDIKFYEQEPGKVLAQQGITPNTLQHFQFEHRLYSRDVKGFFTTGNSAGSFVMLASFAAVALFLERIRNRKSNASGSWWLVTCGIAVAAVFFGLAITRSKGAIAASLIAAAMFITYFLFGNWLKMHKKAILLGCLLLAVVGGSVIVLYGLTHGRLPGGNSMLVRWQYWRGTAKMYADYPFVGVGPGNFAHFYPHYKSAEALETVADPHNFLLSVLTQYGPLGLVGFLAMIFVPLWKVTVSPASSLPEPHRPEPAFKKLAAVFVIAISAALLLIRPIIIPITSDNSLEVMIYVMFILYVMPVIVFIIGFLLLIAPLHSIGGTQYAIRNTNITAAALFCAVLGLLLHNLIDFAIFEPGVFTTLWAVIACLIAIDFHRSSRTPFVLRPALFAKMLIAAVGLILIWAYFSYAFIPVARSTAKIQQACRASSNGQFQQAHSLLADAAKDDCLSPAASFLNGRLYLQSFLSSTSRQAALLLESEKSLLAAIRRNRADFKNFERLAEVYTLLAEISTQQAKTGWLNKAFDSGLLAVRRYPGCARLRFELAKIAERLGRTNFAIEQYGKAIEIEDNYRCQFRQMYGDQKLFSRLGEEEYRNAKQRIEHLSGQPAP